MATDPSMKTQTYYERLELTPNASLVVIRAAYKALSSTYHYDDSLELGDAERFARLGVYADLQEAFDVLNNQEKKAAYDAELTRNDSGVVGKAPALHHDAQSTLTTQEPDDSMRAEAQQSLQRWRDIRGKRQEADAHLSVAELEDLVKIWRDLESETATDPPMKARCAILAYEYMEEISIRELEASLGKTTRPDQRPVTPNLPPNSTTAVDASSPNTSDVTSRSTRSDVSPTPTPFSRLDARTAERKRAEEKRAEEAQARAQARKDRKSQIEAAKQARLEEKAAIVRDDKEKRKAVVERHARAEAARLAWLRAKVRGALMPDDDDFVASGLQGDSLSHRVDASDEGVKPEFRL